MDTTSLKETQEWKHYHFLAQLSEVTKNTDIRWDYAFSEDQLLSKLWIVQTLRDLKIQNLDVVMILGGWVGLLGSILLSATDLGVSKVRSFDIDGGLERIADLLNVHYLADNWKFKAVQADWDLLDYDITSYSVHRYSDRSVVECKDSFKTIVNTSCEHAQNLEKWLSKVPSDRLLILQSNSSSEYEGHVNACATLEEFLDKINLGKVLYAGALPTPRYTRWMAIGYRA